MVASPAGKDAVPTYPSTLTIICALGLAADLGAPVKYQAVVKDGGEKRAGTMKGKRGKTGTQVLR